MQFLQKRSTFIGIIFGIIAGISFGSNPLFAKYLYLEGFDPASVLIMRFVPATLFLGIVILLRGQSLRVTFGELLACAIAGGLFSLTSQALFISYDQMDVGVAATLLFTYPVLVALISGIGFHEKISKTTLAAIVMACGGVALLCRPSSGGNSFSFYGVSMALGAALFYAGYLVWINHSKLKSMSSAKSTFYVVLFCAFFSLCFGKFQLNVNFCENLSWWMLFNILGVSLISSVVSLGCCAVAVKNCGSTITSVLGALEPLTAVALGIIFFGDTVTLRGGIGIALVLCSVIFVALAPSKKTAVKRGGIFSAAPCPWQVQFFKL